MPESPKETKRGVLTDFNDMPKPTGGHSWFFGIGINKYAHFPTLNNAVKDVRDISALLLKEYDFTPEYTITVYDEEATRENIIEALDRLQREVGPADKLLIYYSGHGHLNKEIGKGYWIPTNAERDNTAAYIRNSTVREYIETLKALHTLLISDSCFSGSLFVRGASRSGAAIKELEAIPSRWALCSGRHDEEVFDGEPGSNSPFAESIMDTLRRNARREFNVSRLVDRVVEQTRSNYEQLPEGNPLYGVGHKGGQYIFRRRALESEDWARAKAAGTLPAFRQFLENHPGGQQAAEAKERIAALEEEAAWEKAKNTHTVLAYYEYDKAYPNGRYAHLALETIAELEEEAAWQEAKRRNKLSSYRKYTSEYPQGKYRAEAEAAIEAIIAGHEKTAPARPQVVEKPQSPAPPKAERVEPDGAAASPAPLRKWLPMAAGALLLAVIAIWGIGKISGSSKGGATKPPVEVVEEAVKAPGEEKFSGPLPAYVVNIAAYKNESQAQKKVKELAGKGYAAGYLWPPDFASISNAEMYVVFIGPYSSERQCGKAVEDYRKFDSKVYGVKISQDRERVEIRGVDRVRRIPNYNSGK